MKLFKIVLFLISFPLFSQEIKIFDAETGVSLPGVLVYNQDKTLMLESNEKGIVDISGFKEGSAIHFCDYTYATKSYTKQDLLSGSVFMSKLSEQIDEVVLDVFKNGAKSRRIAEQTALLTKDDIIKISPQTSADLLANVDGVKVQKTQFGGGSPVLRGMESNRVLLVVDGVRMNNAIYRKGHLQNSITVSPNLLEKTEVVFGPSSVIYGSDALGGVIHYYTKTPKISANNTVNGGFFLRYSTVNNEITSSASAELSFKKWASLTAFSRSKFGDLTMGKNRTHGFQDWGEVSMYSTNINGGFSLTPTLNSDKNLQHNTGYTQSDFLQKFHIPLSKTWNMKLNFQYSKSSNIPRFDKLTELKKGKLKFAEWFYGPQKRLFISPQFDYYPKQDWADKVVFTLGYQNIQESRIQRKFGSLNRSHREENVQLYSFNADFSLKTPNHGFLGYGFEAAYNNVISKAFGESLLIVDNQLQGVSSPFDIQTRYPDQKGTYSNIAIYGDFRKDFSTKSTFNLGVRITNTYVGAHWENDAFIKLPNPHIHLNSTALTGTLGFVYKPVKCWQFNTVLSSAFRAPNLDDIGKVREKKGKVTVPNYQLKPEHAYNLEFAVQRYFNDRKFRVGFTGYYTILNDYIQRANYSMGGTSQIIFDGELASMVANLNMGSAYITGFTASYQGKITPQWSTKGSVTYTKGRTFDTDQPMSSIPPLFGNFDILFTKDKIEAGLYMRFNGIKKAIDYNISEGIDNISQTPIVNPIALNSVEKYYGTPSWTTFGVSLKYDIIDNVWLQMRLDNIFDVHYKEFASGVSAPGRNLMLSLNLNL